MGANTVNIRRVSVWWCSYVSSNSEAAFEAQFTRKLNNIDAELKKKMFQFKPFKQFIKCPCVSKCSCVHRWHSSMGVFHVFKNVQMVPNRTKYHKSSQRYDSVRLHVSSLFLHRTRRDYYILLVVNCQQISN